MTTTCRKRKNRFQISLGPAPQDDNLERGISQMLIPKQRKKQKAQTNMKKTQDPKWTSCPKSKRSQEAISSSQLRKMFKFKPVSLRSKDQ